MSPGRILFELCKLTLVQIITFPLMWYWFWMLEQIWLWKTRIKRIKNVILEKIFRSSKQHKRVWRMCRQLSITEVILVQRGVILMTVFLCVCFSVFRQKPRNWRTPPCTWVWRPPNQRWKIEIPRQGRTHRISEASPSAKTRFRSQRWCAPPNSHRTVRHANLNFSLSLCFLPIISSRFSTLLSVKLAKRPQME